MALHILFMPISCLLSNDSVDTPSFRPSASQRMARIVLLLLLGFVWFTPTLLAQSPQADFTASDTVGCDTLENVRLLAAADPLILGYEWDFDGDFIIDAAGEREVFTSYRTPGQFTVRLIITRQDGTRDTMSRVNYIQVFATPRINVPFTDTTICFGSNIALMAIADADSFTWTPQTDAQSNVNNDTVIYRPTADRTYLVVARNGECEASEAINVSVYNNAEFSLTPDSATICLGDTLQLVARNGGITYTWGPTDNLFSLGRPDSVAVFPTRTTTYTVTTRDSFCLFDRTAFVRVIDSIPFRTPQRVFNACEGQRIHFKISGADSYDWLDSTVSVLNPARDTATVLVDSTKPYIVRGTVGRCSRDFSFQVRVTALPLLRIVPDSAEICSGTPINLTASGAERYQWKTDASLSTLRSATTTARPLVTTTYTLLGFNNVCSDSITYRLVVKPIPNVRILTTDSVICRGESTELRADGAQSYRWSTGDSTANITVRPTAVTTYTLTGTTAGCTATARQTIRIQPFPAVTLQATGSTRACQGNSVQLEATGLPFTTYEWLRNGTAIAGARTATYAATESGNYTVRIKPNNCSQQQTTNSINVTIHALPVVSISASAITICRGKMVELTASDLPTATYRWSPDAGITEPRASVIRVQPRSSITYTVVVTDTNRCTAQSTITINVSADSTLAMPTVSPNGRLSRCSNDSAITLTATAPSDAQLQWYRNDHAIVSATSNTIAIQDSGRYWLQASSTTCAASRSAVVTVAVHPVPDFVTEVKPQSAGLYSDGWIRVTAFGGTPPYRYALDTLNFTTQQLFLGLRTDTFLVQVEDANNCLATRQVFLPYPTSRPSLQRPDFDIHVYPNPVQGHLTIDCTNRPNELFDLFIYDAMGRLVWHQAQAQSGSPIAIDITTGFYTLIIEGKDWQLFERLMAK
jgi:hypothetical protein